MKQIFDIILSLIFLIIISPIFILICIFIKIDSPGSIFFITERVGINNTRFKMVKFRSMYKDTEIVETSNLKDANIKVTKIGKFLRKFSIDEVPQFFCVLAGKMSIVGPRPALLSQHDLIEKRKQLGIDTLKPGITGLAQINGRDLISLEKKINFEAEYLKKKNFFFDLKIIIKTIKVVITQKGVSH